MAENIAFEKNKQKSLKKSVDNYKKLLKSGKVTLEETVAPADTVKNVSPRGIVYLSNIPHGFYEDELKQYFNQFGYVTRSRLARSKKTGRSKGFAFIEFKEPEVAKIAAETMNNYLMCKRLLKAKYIAPEEQHEYYFKGRNWTSTQYPGLMNRKRNIKKNHTSLTDQQVQKCTKNYMKHINDVKKKLEKVGVVYNFVPNDVPDNLKLNIEKIKKEKSKNKESQKDTEIHQEQLKDKKLKNKTKSTSLNIVDTPQKNAKHENMEKLSKYLYRKLEGVTKITKGRKIDISTKKIKLMHKDMLSNEQVQLKTVDTINKKRKTK